MSAAPTKLDNHQNSLDLWYIEFGLYCSLCHSIIQHSYCISYIICWHYSSIFQVLPNSNSSFCEYTFSVSGILNNLTIEYIFIHINSSGQIIAKDVVIRECLEGKTKVKVMIHAKKKKETFSKGYYD